MVSMAVAFGVLIGGWALTAEQVAGYPLVLVDQGVTALTFGNEEVDGRTVPKRVFVIRDGSVITILGTTTPGRGLPIVYCPNERFFVAPDDASLFDRGGRYVEGPATGDMFEYRRQIDPENLELFVGDRIERPRSKGQVSGEAAEAYFNWKADPETPQRFCQNPVR